MWIFESIHRFSSLWTLTSMKVLSIVSETCISLIMCKHNHLSPCQQLILAIAVSTEAGPQLLYDYPAITSYAQPLVYQAPLDYGTGEWGSSLLLQVLFDFPSPPASGHTLLDLQTNPAFTPRPQSDLCTIQGN